LPASHFHIPQLNNSSSRNRKSKLRILDVHNNNLSGVLATPLLALLRGRRSGSGGGMPTELVAHGNDGFTLPGDLFEILSLSLDDDDDDDDYNQITSLDLSNCGLVGPIPPLDSVATRLVRVELQGNSFSDDLAHFARDYTMANANANKSRSHTTGTGTGDICKVVWEWLE
jgi:hypothetical protein